MTIDRGTLRHLSSLLDGWQAVQEVYKECIFIVKDQCGLRPYPIPGRDI